MLLNFSNSATASRMAMAYSREPSFPVSPKQAVEVRPLFEPGASCYVMVSTFGVKRIYSVYAVRDGLSVKEQADVAMTFIRRAGNWIKLLSYAPNITVVEDGENIHLRLGSCPLLSVAIDSNEQDYELKFDKDLDLTARTGLGNYIRSNLEEFVMDEQNDTSVICQFKELMKNHEQLIGRKLDYDDWEALLAEAYDQMYKEEKCPPVPPSQ